MFNCLLFVGAGEPSSGHEEGGDPDAQTEAQAKLQPLLQLLVQLPLDERSLLLPPSQQPSPEPQSPQSSSQQQQYLLLVSSGGENQTGVPDPGIRGNGDRCLWSRLSVSLQILNTHHHL